MDNRVLHQKLAGKLDRVILDIKENMIARFAIILPYDEAQFMLMHSNTFTALQDAGELMQKQYMHYSYKLGEKITINITCRGGKKMPAIFFPTNELIIYSEEFLDLVRPLYLMTKAWQDVELAFQAVRDIVSDTRELNFYVPWLRYVIPDDLMNEFNMKYRVTGWVNLHGDKFSTIDVITRQIKDILTNEHTNKRSWMPSELVAMARQGEELITQYNIMKTVPLPDTYPSEDQVAIGIDVDIKDHPTIKWTAEAIAHKRMLEGERLAEIDRKRTERMSR